MAAAVKQDPESGAVAVRNTAVAEDAPNAWGVMHPTNGGHWSNTEQVADWDDLAPVSGGDA